MLCWSDANHSNIAPGAVEQVETQQSAVLRRMKSPKQEDLSEVPVFERRASMGCSQSQSQNATVQKISCLGHWRSSRYVSQSIFFVINSWKYWRRRRSCLRSSRAVRYQPDLCELWFDANFARVAKPINQLVQVTPPTR